MNKYRYCLTIVTVLLLLSKVALAQNSTTGRETKKADVNFAELAKYYQEHPKAIVRRMPLNEEEEEDQKPRHRPGRGANVHLIDRTASGTRSAESPNTAYLPVSPAPVDTFLSTLTNGADIPPDTHGAVDSQYCVTAINTNIHIQTRAGANVYNIGLDGFWSSVLPAGTSPFDPRVFYDPYKKRWILITDAVSGAMTSSTVLIAVSATNDPTGVWHMYTIAVDPTGASWMDFPNVGFNSKWITVTGNMFANTGAGIGGAIVYVFDYNSIAAGTGAPHTVFYQSNSFAICAAVTYDTTEPNMYALETWNGGAGQLNLWKISGPVASPTMLSLGNPATTTHWRGNPPGGGDFAPQSSIPNLINIGDDRITSVTYRNHKLWCSHTVFLPAGGTTTRSSVMWWQLDTTGSPIQNGLIDDPTSAKFYAYSSIAVNANDDALIGMGIFSGTTHPSAAYSLHMHTDPADSARPAITYRHGQASYYETFGGGRNRWGDYSGTCIDPRNDTDFWTIQESSFVGAAPNWDTWWAHVQFCPKPLAPAILSTPGTLCVGASGEYYLDSIPGATSYQWIVSGTGWVAGSSSADSIKLLAGTTVATVSVVAYNSCGEGESLVFNITPGTAPATAPSITTITPACAGSSTAIFTASDPGASSYSWQTFGTGWSGASSTPSLTTIIGTGSGTVICTAANSCGTGPADTFIVTPAVVPTAAFIAIDTIVNVNVNDSVIFTGSAPPGCTYAWTYGLGTATPSTMGAGPYIVYWTAAGLNTLSLTVTNAGCPSNFYTANVHVIDTVVTGVKQLNQHSSNFNIVPNPNDGSFEIMFDKAISNTLLVKLADMQGRIVYNKEFNGTTNNKLSISTSNLPSGNYVITILNNGAPVTEKVTISR